jgi:hypothetical protein
LVDRAGIYQYLYEKSDHYLEPGFDCRLPICSTLAGYQSPEGHHHWGENMSETTWHRDSCGPGRAYMLGKEPHIKYDDPAAIVASIVEGLRPYLNIETAVRLTLDGSLTNAERIIMAIPFEADHDGLLNNFAQVIYHSLMGYYVSADPRTAHFGIANLLIEGNANSLLRREIEKTIQQFHYRPDMAGRLIRNIEFSSPAPVPPSGDLYLAETIRKGLDIHVGYRVFAAGEDINYAMLFIPLPTGQEIIDLIYYNLEQILLHNFIAYDETGDRYLTLSETLVFKELEALLQRARSKTVTRHKILQNLQFDVIQKAITEETSLKLIGDRLYDFLNNIQDVKCQQASERSRDLLAAYLTEKIRVVREKTGDVVDTAGQTLSDNQAPAVPPLKRTREQLPPRPGTAPAVKSPPPTARPAPDATTGQRRLRPGTEVPAPPEEKRRVPGSRLEATAEGKSRSAEKTPVPSR